MCKHALFVKIGRMLVNGFFYISTLFSFAFGFGITCWFIGSYGLRHGPPLSERTAQYDATMSTMVNAGYWLMGGSLAVLLLVFILISVLQSKDGG